MTALVALETQLCSVCDALIQIGDPYVLIDDSPVHESCEVEALEGWLVD